MEKENGMKRRPRSDTAVRKLTPEQRIKVDGWRFQKRTVREASSATRWLPKKPVFQVISGYFRVFQFNFEGGGGQLKMQNSKC
jgi:hypothetical protein